MARITPSALVDDIKGSVGGVTFASWKGITIVRSKARSVRNPATKAQELIRNAIGFYTKRYFDDLTDQQRGEWDQYAQEMAGAERSDQVQGGFGARVVTKRKYQKSGHGWYDGNNVAMTRRFGNLNPGTPIDEAPLGQTAPSQPVIVSVVYQEGLGRFQVTHENPEDFGHASQVRVALWIKPNWGKARIQGVSRFDTPGEQIGPRIVQTLPIPRAVLERPLPDGVYAFQMDAIGEQNAMLSPPSNIVIIQAKFVEPPALLPEDLLEGEEWRG